MSAGDAVAQSPNAGWETLHIDDTGDFEDVSAAMAALGETRRPDLPDAPAATSAGFVVTPSHMHWLEIWALPRMYTVHPTCAIHCDPEVADPLLSQAQAEEDLADAVPEAFEQTCGHLMRALGPAAVALGKGVPVFLLDGGEHRPSACDLRVWSKVRLLPSTLPSDRRHQAADPWWVLSAVGPSPTFPCSSLLSLGTVLCGMFGGGSEEEGSGGLNGLCNPGGLTRRPTRRGDSAPV